jgi:GNAT superfamily N-acetyltransferase
LEYLLSSIVEHRGGQMVVAAVSVVEAERSDFPVVRELLARSNEQYRSVIDPAAFEPYLAMVLDLDSRAEAASVLLTHVEGRLAGTVTYFPDAGDEGWGAASGTSGLRSMAVDPDHRGLGIGRALVEVCAARARAHGASALTLHTASWLPDAIRLYERCGFVRDPDADHRATDLMDVPPHADYAALAYRLEL